MAAGRAKVLTETQRSYRAGLAGVDTLTIIQRGENAQQLLWDNHLSAALDELDEVAKAVARARKVIRTGR